jgi:hypothetical protein
MDIYLRTSIRLLNFQLKNVEMNFMINNYETLWNYNEINAETLNKVELIVH